MVPRDLSHSQATGGGGLIVKRVPAGEAAAAAAAAEAEAARGTRATQRERDSDRDGEGDTLRERQ
jgi:hypothetical protein